MADRVTAVKNFPQQKGIENVQSFLCLAGYYWPFMKGFAKLASPLKQLLKKDVSFHWDAAQERSFQDLKSVSKGARFGISRFHSSYLGKLSSSVSNCEEDNVCILGDINAAPGSSRFGELLNCRGEAAPTSHGCVAAAKPWLEWCRSIGAHTPLGEMWCRVRAIYSPRSSPLPTHSVPHEEADRLAQLSAARTSPSILPTATQRRQSDLANVRAAIVADACAEETATNAPFAMRELNAVLLHRPHGTRHGQIDIFHALILGPRARLSF